METKTEGPFDQTAFYDANILPLLKEAHRLCVEHEIQFFAVAAVAKEVINKDGDDYERWDMRSTVNLDGQKAPPEMMMAEDIVANGLANMVPKLKTILMLSTLAAMGMGNPEANKEAPDSDPASDGDRVLH